MPGDGFVSVWITGCNVLWVGFVGIPSSRLISVEKINLPFKRWGKKKKQQPEIKQKIKPSLSFMKIPIIQLFFPFYTCNLNLEIQTCSETEINLGAWTDN